MKKKMGPSSSTEFQTLLRQAGYKATPARLAILQLLEKNTRPISIQEIQQQFGRKKTMDQATIYRTLEVLQLMGLIRSVDLHQGRSYYELHDPHDHHHIICVKCERIEDFSGCKIESLQQRALKQTSGFAKILEHSLELFGVCKKCST